MWILLDLWLFFPNKYGTTTGRRGRARSGLLEHGNAEKTDSSAMRVCGPYGGAICFIPTSA